MPAAEFSVTLRWTTTSRRPLRGAGDGETRRSRRRPPGGAERRSIFPARTALMPVVSRTSHRRPELLLRRTLYLSNSQEQRRTQVDFLVPCTTVTAFSAYIFPIYTHTTNCKRKRERRSGGASLTPSGMHAMRATTLETCAIPHARPCRAASGCTRHDANKTHAVGRI